VRDLAEAVRELIGEHVRIEHRDARPGDYAGKEVSPGKAMRLLGWQATTSFREGLRRYIEWHRATHA
jgi:UDP-glucose 4-epimerase